MTDSERERDRLFAETGPALEAERIRTGAEPGPKWYWDTCWAACMGHASAIVDAATAEVVVGSLRGGQS